MCQRTHLKTGTLSNNPNGHKTVDEIARFLAYLTADKGYSHETIVSYGRSLRDFDAFRRSREGQPAWTDVDADMVRVWVAGRRAKGIQPRTLRHELTSLRSFYRYLMRMGEARRNPAALVPNPKADKPLPSFVRQDEMDRLLDHTTFPDTPEGRRDHMILLLLYSTGIRRGEIIHLNVEDIDCNTDELKVTGKRNKQRIIPFGRELHDELTAYLDERAAYVESLNGELSSTAEDGTETRDRVLPWRGPLLPDRNRRRHDAPLHRIGEGRVNGIVRTYLSMVTTQKRRSPHVLRHTFATVMLNNGADLEAVKELLGHESLATTEIYTHTTLTELRKEYAKAHPRSRKDEDE